MTTRADIANETNRKLYQNHMASMAKLREARLRIEQLEAALRPFAAAADTLDKEGWDNLHIEGSNADVTGEHCRAARAALEGKDG